MPQRRGGRGRRHAKAHPGMEAATHVEAQVWRGVTLARQCRQTCRRCRRQVPQRPASPAVPVETGGAPVPPSLPEVPRARGGCRTRSQLSQPCSGHRMCSAGPGPRPCVGCWRWPSRLVSHTRCGRSRVIGWRERASSGGATPQHPVHRSTMKGQLAWDLFSKWTPWACGPPWRSAWICAPIAVVLCPV